MHTQCTFVVTQEKKKSARTLKLAHKCQEQPEVWMYPVDFTCRRTVWYRKHVTKTD